MVRDRQVVDVRAGTEHTIPLTPAQDSERTAEEARENAMFRPESEDRAAIRAIAEDVGSVTVAKVIAILGPAPVRPPGPPAPP